MMENRFFFARTTLFSHLRENFCNVFSNRGRRGRNQPIRVEAREIFIFIIEWNTSREGGGEKSKKGFCSKYDIIANWLVITINGNIKRPKFARD